MQKEKKMFISSILNCPYREKNTFHAPCEYKDNFSCETQCYRNLPDRINAINWASINEKQVKRFNKAFIREDFEKMNNIVEELLNQQQKQSLPA